MAGTLPRNPGILFTLVFLLSLLDVLGGSRALAAVTAIRNVNVVIPEENRVVERQTVFVEGAEIRELRGGDDVRDASTVIDGDGAYLIPGLVDAHMHHWEGVDYLNYIAHGVTTVIGLGQGRSGEAFNALNTRIDAGELIGPRIYTTAQTIANHIQIDDPDEAREFVRSLKADGFALVKVYNNIPRDVFAAVVEEAELQSLPVFGHLPRTFPTPDALRGGLDVVAHVEEFYFAHFGGPRDQQLDGFDGSELPDLAQIDAIIALMLEHDVALIPNLIFSFVTQRFWEDEEAALAHPELAYSSPGLRDAWRASNGARRNMIEKRMLRERIKYAFSHEFTRRAHVAGVLLVAGTDAPVRGVLPGASMHGEMREFVKTGLSPAEALSTATANAGLLMRRYVDPSVRLGRVAPGFEADLVLLRANPLEDVRHAADIAGVMSDGVWYSAEQLAAARRALAERYSDNP